MVSLSCVRMVGCVYACGCLAVEVRVPALLTALLMGYGLTCSPCPLQHLNWKDYDPKKVFDVKYNFGTKDIFDSNGMKRMKVCGCWREHFDAAPVSLLTPARSPVRGVVLAARCTCQHLSRVARCCSSACASRV